MDHLHQRLEALEDEVRTVQRRLRRWRQLAGSVLGLALVCLLQPWGLAAQAPGDGPDCILWQLVNLWGRVRALERTLTHVTSGTGAGGLPEVVIAGADGTKHLYTMPPHEGGAVQGADQYAEAHSVPRSAAGSTIRPVPARLPSVAGGGIRSAVRARRSAAGMGTRPTAIPRRSVGAKQTRLAALPPPSAAGATARLVGTSTGSPARASPMSRDQANRGGPARRCGGGLSRLHSPPASRRSWPCVL
jgi:hypothetical protein